MLGTDESTAEEKDEKYNSIDFEMHDFILWSKEKYSETLSEEELLKKFKKRFEKNLPLKHINLLFIEREVP